ncbi:Hypothetical protein NTJ_12725 [Nesidiocoris tenuis]|uniref:C2H2-type domain-containing protein n=1 Tax=Nesidiocoris tenuis TaxID=355587 RepID=A0ABN7B6N3_9HEMI|nr:Hypothetical protein NTJ_12725 [Nesidiocoris tenuis]
MSGSWSCGFIDFIVQILMFPPPFRAPHPPLPKGSYDQYGGYTGGYAKEPAGGYGRSQYGFGEKNILGPYGKRFMGIYSENYHGPRHMEKPYFPPAIPPQNYYHNQDLNDEIHCFTCDIWCHGPAQYTAHTQGSKHQKQVKEEKNRRAVSKMKFIKYDEASNTYECTYCRTALNSCSVVVMHVAGVRHQDKAYEIEGPRPSSVKEAPKKLEEETKTTENGVTVTTIGDYATYHCKECNISANSETQMAQHLASQRHLAKDQWKPNQRRGGKFKAHWVAANGGEGPPTHNPAPPSTGLKLMACEICNIMVNSAAQMAQHTASLRHKNNLAGIRYEPYVKTA